MNLMIELDIIRNIPLKFDIFWPSCSRRTDFFLKLTTKDGRMTDDNDRHLINTTDLIVFV